MHTAWSFSRVASDQGLSSWGEESQSIGSDFFQLRVRTEEFGII